MSDRQGKSGALPGTGLAEELVPLLRERLAAGKTAEAAPSARGRRAASALLDFADAVEGVAREVEPAPPERTRQFVTFSVGAAEFGLPIECVQEVLRVGPITRVPQAPAHVAGVTNVRGRVLPVLELGPRIGAGPVELTKDSRIVTVEMEGRLLGILVDRASSVAAVADSAIEDPPGDVVSAEADYVVGVARVGARVIILLDLERVLAPAT